VKSPEAQNLVQGAVLSGSFKDARPTLVRKRVTELALRLKAQRTQNRLHPLSYILAGRLGRLHIDVHTAKRPSLLRSLWVRRAGF